MIRYEGPDTAADAVLARWPEVVPGEGRVQAFLLGPGVDPARVSTGRSDADQDDARQVARIAAVLRGQGQATWDGEALPCVVDAGALVVLAGLSDRSAVFARERARPRPGSRLLLTPHAGELAALLTAIGGSDVSRAEVEARPWLHACRAADVTGATVLLKGSVTLVVQPLDHHRDGARRARSQGPAPSWLATAGSGDVLAGIAGALLAAGLDPLDAGSLAAVVHARAAAVGPVTAAAIADAVPGVVRQLLSAESVS
jgi:NAD(P)H-hydrate repair Nnr-like enzyme with NAD(P)H-hydrate dehydratase domain